LRVEGWGCTSAAGMTLPPMQANSSAITDSCPNCEGGLEGDRGCVLGGLGLEFWVSGFFFGFGFFWVRAHGFRFQVSGFGITTRVASEGGLAAHASSSGISRDGTWCSM